MRLSSALLPVAGTIVLSAAAPASLGTFEPPAVLEDRAPVPDLGDFLNDLPAMINDIVTTSISIARALKQAVKDDALVRNDLDTVLGGNGNATAPAPGAGETPDPTDGNTNGDENDLEARQDGGEGNQNGVPGTAPCPDIAVLYARGTKEPGMNLIQSFQ